MQKTDMTNTIIDIIDQRFKLDPVDQQSAEQVNDLISHCAGDEEALRRWRNYHLIGDVIRGEVIDTGSCLLDKIGAAMEREPTVLVPVNFDQDAITPPQQPVTAARPWRSAAMVALAASVAIFAVLTLAPAPINGNLSQNGSGDLLAAGSPKAVTISALTATGSAASNSGVALSDSQFSSEFGQMLVEHGEFTATPGLNGLVAYAKLVSNEGLGR